MKNKISRKIIFTASSLLLFAACKSVPNQKEFNFASEQLVHTNQGVGEFGKNTIREMPPIETVIKVKTPGVIIAWTQQDLDKKLAQLPSQIILKDQPFNLTQENNGALKLKSRHLSSGEIQFRVTTTSQYNRLTLLSRSKNETIKNLGAPPYNPYEVPLTFYIALESSTSSATDVDLEWSPISVSGYNPYGGGTEVRLSNDLYKGFVQSYNFSTAVVDGGPSEVEQSLFPSSCLASSAEITDVDGYFPDLIQEYNEIKTIYRSTYSEGQSPSYSYRCNIHPTQLATHEFFIDPPLQNSNQGFSIKDEEGFLSFSAFSPRDQDNNYDKLSLNISVPEETDPWKVLIKPQRFEEGLITEVYEASLQTGEEVAGTGSQIVEWDGFNNGICTKDGYYEMLIVKTSADPLALTEADFYQKESFYVDNTPPILQTQTFLQETVDEELDEYLTHVSFEVVDPEIEFPEYLPAKPSGTYDTEKPFDADAIKETLIISAQEKIFGTPVLDEDGFWITNATDHVLASEAITVTEVRKGRYKVEFAVPYTLSNSQIEVSVKDRIGNTATYLLNPEESTGGNP